MLYRIFGILFGVFLLFLSWKGYEENQAFQLYGQNTYLEPISKYIEKTTTYTHKSELLGKSSQSYKENMVEAYFVTDTNVRVKISGSIPKEVIEKLIRQEPVEITYLTNDSSKVRFGSRGPRVIEGAVAGIILLALSLFSLRNTLVKN
ncbi:MAG: hypothetical protein REI12_07715 [Pedobacter sp.]|nr:hypothetical protein [Pedobacter sp.]